MAEPKSTAAYAVPAPIFGAPEARRLTAVLPAGIRSRWDRLALEQLAQRVTELDAELARAEEALYWADQNANQADHYQALYHEACDQLAECGETPCAQPGITAAGELVIVRAETP
jgi:hypothetical protein